MLFRKIQTYIEDYFNSNSNKVLLIEGARQIGKTYIIRYVGKKMFENYIEIYICRYILLCLYNNTLEKPSNSVAFFFIWQIPKNVVQ